MRGVRALTIAAWATSCAPTQISASPEAPPRAPSDGDLDASSAKPTSTVAQADAQSEHARPPDTVYRDELRRATHGGSPGYLMAQLLPEPYRPRGPREGWRITRVFPDDPDLCAAGCDLEVGDVILTVNGSPLERPEQLSSLVASIETMETLEVRLVRDGTLHERSYSVRNR